MFTDEYLFIIMFIIMPPPPFEEDEVYCSANVGRTVDKLCPINN